jgi:PEP-CTERM motif
MHKYLLPGAALMSLVSGGAGAATLIGTFSKLASTANPAPAGSTGLGPLGAVGGIGGPYTFTAPFTGTLVVKVQPSIGKFGGDVYQAFVDGNSLGFTPQVPLGMHLSVGTFTTPVSMGVNNFDVNDQLLSYIGSPPPFGSTVASLTTVPQSFSPSGVLITLTEELPSAVPEPRSLATLAGGLLGLCFFWRRRKAG